MFCANCTEKIVGKPIKQATDYYCSLECANLASGIEPEEEEYFEEEMIDEYFGEEE
ncbi:MAG: hypothetical protein SGI97_09875 [candidate division Zixibacteria bacterium]|nr:hypothetical protein [candidate division Zixibacteria bacterium]